MDLNFNEQLSYDVSGTNSHFPGRQWRREESGAKTMLLIRMGVGIARKCQINSQLSLHCPRRKVTKRHPPWFWFRLKLLYKQNFGVCGHVKDSTKSFCKILLQALASPRTGFPTGGSARPATLNTTRSPSSRPARMTSRWVSDHRWELQLWFISRWQVSEVCDVVQNHYPVPLEAKWPRGEDGVALGEQVRVQLQRDVGRQWGPIEVHVRIKKW